MAMRPDMANGAVAGKRETSFEPTLLGFLATTNKETQ